MTVYNCLVDATMINREVSASTLQFLQSLSIEFPSLIGKAIELILNTNGVLTSDTLHLHVDRSFFTERWQHSAPTEDTFSFESSMAIYIRTMEILYMGLVRAVMYFCIEDVKRRSGLDVFVKMQYFDMIDDGPSFHLVFDTDWLPF